MIESYIDCTRCGLHKFRRKIVFGRGEFPADIFFIGEGPGKSEDLRGEAFIGKSGRMLDTAIKEAFNLSGLESIPTFYITNVVACRPTNERYGPNRTPSSDEAWACWPRLDETYHKVKPRIVIFIGQTAKQFCKEAFPHGYHLVHPAYILRKGGYRATEYRTFVRNLTEIFKSLQRSKHR
ncbi:MAG: hypothetical protein FVQ84_08285 [Planctomycetes bacterium]|nr:hypothetical protein [Planctomycetota bacterium]